MVNFIKYSSLFAFVALLTACDSESKFDDLDQAIKRNKYDVREIIVQPTKTITVGNEDGMGTTYLSLDFSEKFKATGITSSGREIDISDQINWSSSNNNIAQVNQTGTVTTFGNSGAVSIIAKFASIQGVAMVQVSAEPLAALEIAFEGQVVATPHNIDVCQPTQFTALGTYGASEPKRVVTHLVDWAVSHTPDNPISRVFNQQSKKGLFGAWDTSGSVTAALTISLNAVQSTPVELNIQGSISVINISPNGATVPISSKQQFTATSTIDITDAADWSTPSNAISLNDTTPGLVTGVAVGSASLDVSCGGVNDSVTVTVTASAKVERISIDYSGPEEFVDMTQSQAIELSAIAHKSDGTTIDITEDDNTNWSVRIIDTDLGRPISVTNDADAIPPDKKGRVTHFGDDIPVGEKRFAEVVVNYNNLEDDIVVVVTP